MNVRRLLCTLTLSLLAAAGARPAHAGGGPENVLVVVNAASWASVTVANAFIKLRQIPASNVVYLNWTGGWEKIDGETFREQIIMPVVQTLNKRRSFSQIDYIVYSSDFPYHLALAKDFEGASDFPAQLSPNCSINSATYLWHLLLIRSPQLLDFKINNYMRAIEIADRQISRKTDPPTHGFRSWYGWGTQGSNREAGGQPYMLSTMLAMTSGRGNSVREAISYLSRAAAADGTFPKGTIYFTNTEDVRSRTRAGEVPAAVADLEKLGVQAKVVASDMPQNCPDVAGLISGVPKFSWAKTRSTILPGAICDNFTSFGGVLTEKGGGQTPLTEFLRYGAAGSAGTVVEPYAIAEKFASPNIFVHYARGCTLAEAYYQSLYSPAQVLIVGDPLCRPWANIPQVQVAGVASGDRVSGTVALTAAASLPRGGTVGRFELFADGLRVDVARAGEPLEWDSTKVADGHHELRVVGIEDGPIESQGRAIFDVVVDNYGHSATLVANPPGRVRWDEPLAVDVRAPGMTQAFVINNGRMLGKIDGEAGRLQIDPRVLGLGPVSLQAVAVSGSEINQRVVTPRLDLTIDPPRMLPALPPVANLVPGLMLQAVGNQLVPIQNTYDPSWLSQGGVGPNEPFVFQGIFDVDVNDVYQFQVWHYGELSLEVDGQGLYVGAEGDYTLQFVPVALAKGQHRLTVGGKTATNTNLRILFGGPGAESLKGTAFRHARR